MMSSHTNQTIANVLINRFCKENKDIDTYVANLTRSYADQSNEVSMVAASVIMFLLAGLFFILNLFSRFSDVSAILNPKVRVFLSSALSLFLPVMSYLFSEAKNAGPGSSAVYGHKSDLSVQAGVILVWMLLVELIRKKVDEIHMKGYSSTIQRAGRVFWLGNLVFFNIRSAGRRAFFGILWILCATKVVQRIAFTEVGKRSYAYGKNARLIASYMSRRQRREQPDTSIIVERTAVDQDGDDPLKMSEFIVMGEEELIVEATADGYKLKDVPCDGTIVTVGRIWRQLNHTIDPDQRLKRLCLSFSLFKLLRRKLERLTSPVTKEETEQCRDVIFNGVYNEKEEMVDAVFQMISTEVNFLSEYYHSVIPVVFASPFFFLMNYFLLPAVVLGLCLMTVMLCGNGDGLYAFRSIKTDNFAISSGVVDTTICLIAKATKSPPAFFTTVDFFVTFFLFIIFFYEEIWEFVVFLFSNWFMVSLLFNYVTKPHLRSSPTFCGIIQGILWVRSKMSKPTLSIKQFSILNIRWPLALGMPSLLSLTLPSVSVPTKAKHSIMKCLVAHSHHGSRSLSNGKSVLAGQDQLWPACDSESVTEVILTWHIATSLFEEAHPPNSSSKDYSMVATRLSKYCAYLVAFHPELLPDNQDKTEKVLEDVKKELKGMLTCCNYYFSRWHTRVNMIMNRDTAQWKDKEVVHNGAKLGKLLWDFSDPDRTWKLLADFWTELLIYLAPSSDEECLAGHEKVLVEGGEFITVIWALTTHTGIIRLAEN